MRNIFLTTALLGLSAAMPATAATVTGWNLDNVAPGGDVPDGTTGVSEVFVDATSPESNGRIAYTPPEAVSPGLVVLNDAYTSGQGTFDGCIRASVGGVDCATGFQTGNRFKLQLTDTGAVDLVFDIDPASAGTQGGLQDDGSFATPGVNTYQVFGRAVNLTGMGLDGFTLELGYGVGDGFTASGADDGLNFAQGLELGPNDLSAFTQYPFGLFGDAPTTNATLDGFFDNARTGFNVDLGSDLIASTGFYGGLLSDGVTASSGLDYENRFGSWLSQDMAPAGLTWDNDNDPATDAIVMAWQLEDGTWQALRDIGDLSEGTAVSILTSPLAFADRAAAELYFTSLGAVIVYEDHIEDVANLNINFGIELASSFIGWGDSAENKNFTLRLTSIAAPVSPVPLPAGAPLLLAGLAMIGFLGKRRAA